MQLISLLMGKREKTGAERPWAPVLPEPALLAQFSKHGRGISNSAVVITGFAGIFVGITTGWWRWGVIAVCIVSMIVSLAGDWARSRHDTAEKNQAAQDLLATIDMLMMLSIKLKNSVTPKANGGDNLSTKRASTREAIMASVPQLVGGNDRWMRANLFVPLSAEPGATFSLAENGFAGRGFESDRTFTPADETYQAALNGKGRYVDDLVDPKLRYAGYATAPIISGDANRGNQRLHGILTVDAENPGVLRGDLDMDVLALLSNLLAITFLGEKSANGVPCSETIMATDLQPSNMDSNEPLPSGGGDSE